jgi:hypothetical protein
LFESLGRKLGKTVEERRRVCTTNQIEVLDGRIGTGTRS